MENSLLLAPPKQCSIQPADIRVRIIHDAVLPEIELSSDIPAFNVVLELSGKKCRFSDNNFDLIPSFPRRITIHPSQEYENPESILESLHIHSLRNY